jgi:hypothetical protein
MATAKATGTEELINHYGAVRLRVNGSAQLQMSLFSLDEEFQKVLLPVSITAINNVEPNRICNFTQQRAKLMIRTVNFGEYFKISKIIVYVKPVAKSYPE